MTGYPMPPGASHDEDDIASQGEQDATGNASQAAAPFEEASQVEDEQLRGNAPLDPDKGAP